MSENQIKANAVSVYGQDGLDDFPVLKAFQQYIDAEQNKARKRMIVLCVFFGFLVTVMATAFMLILKDVSGKNQELTGKNQELNDRLLEYVMKNGERQNVIVQPPAPAPSNDTAIKAMTDTLMAMQQQMAAQQEKVAAAQAEAQKAAAQAAAGPTKEQLACQRQIDDDTRKLTKARALLKAEQEKLAAEKENLRQQEIELQRRRMYPEYYEKLNRESNHADENAKPAVQKKPKPAPRQANMPNRQATSVTSKTAQASYINGGATERDDIDDLISDLPPIEAETERQTAKPPAAKPAVRPAPAKPKPAEPAVADQQVKKPVDKPTKVPEADHFNVPLEINGETSDWLIPAI